MGGIFLSYRRDDAAGHTGRLYDRLSAHFGRDQVFRDIDSLSYGTEFLEAVTDAIRDCDSLVAVIGREWAAVTQKDGTRRLDDPKDFVRLEVAVALERGMPVIPVLVEGAEMPSVEDLPLPLVRLAGFNGLSLSDDRWDYDVKRLTAALERWTPSAAAIASSGAGGPASTAPPTPPAPAPRPAASPAPTGRSFGELPGWLKVGLPVAAVAVLGAVLLLLVAGGGGDEGGGGTDDPPVTDAVPVREFDVEVTARQAWTVTSISLQPGDEVSVRATGRMRDDIVNRPSRRFGPDGVHDPVEHAGDPYPGMNHAALLGRVGDGEPFPLGAAGAHRVDQAGVLALGMNDSHFGDNDGSYQVHVTVRSR